MPRLAIVLAVVVLISAALWLSRDEGEGVRATLALAEAMGGDTTGYARAQGVRPFSFPADHGPHPAYKSEWWYYTGNLETPTGRRFGYQFTLFRFAVAPPSVNDSVPESAWAADQIFMGHFTLTDVETGRFYASERLSRGAAGLAGADAEPLRVWLEDWEITGEGGPVPPMQVRAVAEEHAVDLTLTPLKPPVLQGDRGFDRKGEKAGDASYYYSITRLATEGTVTVEGERYPVTGLSWMDREWSTSALGENQVGWDWFSLHLSDGRDLMYYQIRERDGGISPFSDGVLVGPVGEKVNLSGSDVTLEVLDRWRSPNSGAEYPAAWRLRIPEKGVSLEIRPYVADQELDVSVRYWEGAVRISGTVKGKPDSGSGYVEMTGYGDAEEKGKGEEERGGRL